MSDTSSDVPNVPNVPGRDFIRDLIDRDRAEGKYGGRVVTRFPPEPNGYLHIGHAKSICLNFGLAEEYGGTCHLRFDDTNPETEDQEYVGSIQHDLRWLGFDWGKNLFHASDYFEPLYDFAVDLIKLGKAYVCSLSEDEIREYRGTVKEPGRNSPYRDRSVDENLGLFARMRTGEFEDGAHVLRGKIDMSAANMKMRDPLLYRIKHTAHYRRGDSWHVYPMYDFAHPLSDAIEKITHSLCTLEFENNRDIYDWLVETLPIEEPPRQTEFARLNLTYTIMSKRKLLELVEKKLVSGWDDPRMPTLAGLRRRGFTPAALRDFCDRIGVAKANSTVDVTLLEHCQREALNLEVPRVMCVLRPLKLVIENYPEGGPENQVEQLDAPLYPHDVPKVGSRELPFSRTLYIERDDFAEVPPKGFHRLSPGREVRLRYAYFVRCESVIKDPATGEVTEVRCTYDPATRGGSSPEGRKVPGTLHWVSAEHSLPVEVRLYDRLFKVERPDLEEGGFETTMNPNSLEVLADARLEPAAVKLNLGDRFQFERQGYFYRDPIDSTTARPVYNRTVQLRDSWAAEVQKQAPQAPAPPSPPAAAKAPKVVEEKTPEPLTAEEQELLDRLRPELAPSLAGVLAAHPAEVEKYRAGKTGLLGFLVAQAMKQVAATGAGGGQASPRWISVLLLEAMGGG